MAVTYADMAGADPQTICAAATWSNNCTFAKFCRLDAVANSDAEFGRRVLMLASFSTLAQYHWGGYCILPSVESAQDTSTLAVALGTARALAYTNVYVVMIMRWNTSCSTVWKLQSAAIDPSRADPPDWIFKNWYSPLYWYGSIVVILSFVPLVA